MSSSTRERALLVLITLTTSATAVILSRLALIGQVSEHRRWLEMLHGLMLAIVVIGSLVLLIRRKVSRVMWEGIFAIAAVVGVWYGMLLTGQALSIVVVISAALTFGAIVSRRVIVHDVFYLIGSAGLGVAVATWLPWQVIVIGLVSFAAYDTVAAPVGGAIRHLTATISNASVLPGIVLPATGSGWLKSIAEIDRERAVLIGAGDLVFMSALASQFAVAGIRQGSLFLLGIVGGGCIGLAIGGRHPSRFVLVVIAASASALTIGIATVRLFAR